MSNVDEALGNIDTGVHFAANHLENGNMASSRSLDKPTSEVTDSEQKGTLYSTTAAYRSLLHPRISLHEAIPQ